MLWIVEVVIWIAGAAVLGYLVGHGVGYVRGVRRAKELLTKITIEGDTEPDNESYEMLPGNHHGR